MSVTENRSGTDRELPDPETWVDRYGDYLYGYALIRVQNQAIAEDLVQETFLAALQTHGSFEGRSTVRTWLIGILKHKLIDHLRRKSREQPAENLEALTDSMDALFDEKGRWKIEPTEWAVDPVKVLEEKEFWTVFHRCLSELPTRSAQAFALREMDGLKSEEVCNVLNVSATNFWVMVHRARMSLRRCLEINWFSPRATES